MVRNTIGNGLSAHRRFALICLCALLSAGLGMQSTVEGKASDNASIPRASLLKVAFLYNFAKFTYWPARVFPDRQTPLRFCFIGDDPFGPALEAIRGKRVQERSVVISRYATRDGVEVCHVLFVGASEQGRVEELLGSLGKAPILTVSDMPDFAQSGGIIRLKTVENKIRFEINLDAAERAGLRFNSELLMVAEIVRIDQKASAQ